MISWKKLYNKEFTQLNVTSQVFNNNPQGSHLMGGGPDGGIVYRD